MTALEEYEDRHEVHFAGPAAKTPWIRRIESKYADAAIESLKVCGNCDSHSLGSAYDEAESYCIACLREWERHHFNDFDGWTKKVGPYSWTEVDPSDPCHFTRSRWTERER